MKKRLELCAMLSRIYTCPCTTLSSGVILCPRWKSNERCGFLSTAPLGTQWESLAHGKSSSYSLTMLAMAWDRNHLPVASASLLRIERSKCPINKHFQRPWSIAAFERVGCILPVTRGPLQWEPSRAAYGLSLWSIAYAAHLCTALSWYNAKSKSILPRPLHTQSTLLLNKHSSRNSH